MTVDEEIAELKQYIKYLDDRYYGSSIPPIPDEAYDAYKQLLRQLQSGELPSVPAHASYQLSDHVAEHTYPMLSLDNVFGPSEFKEWYDRAYKTSGTDYAAYQAPLLYEKKYDGIAISLVYNNGCLSQALTRGDGTSGEVITENTWKIPSIPKFIRVFTDQVTVRGEIVVLQSSFERLNLMLSANRQSKYAHPRSAASGILQQKDPDEKLLEYLTLMCYDFEPKRTLIKPEPVTALDAINSFTDLNPQFKFDIGNTYFSKVDELHQLASNRRATSNIPIDGLVFKFNSLDMRDKLGATGHHPRWAIAYKFGAVYVKAKIQDIEWTVGRTGKITPVAHITPINIDGSIIKKLSLHNFSYIMENDIRIGDYASVYKAGEIIPQISHIDPLMRKQMTTEPKEVEAPVYCPVCSAKITRKTTKTWVCPNTYSCGAQTSISLQHWVSKEGMDIEFLAVKTLEKLEDAGAITTVDDIYGLFIENLLELDGIEEISAQKIYDNIQNSIKQPLKRVIYALGITGVGKATATELARHLYDLDHFKSLSWENYDELMAIPDVGDTRATNILDFVQEHQRVLDNLISYGIGMQQKSETPSNERLKDIRICVSGTFDNWILSRKELKELIPEIGAKLVSGVGAHTHVLIAGHKAGPAKMAAAEKHGTVVITNQSELNDLISGKMNLEKLLYDTVN